MNNVLELFRNIRCFVFDMDGVLTDGSLLVLSGGVWARRMNIKDGYALQLAVKNGFQVVVISGSQSDEVRDRLERLGVTEVHMKVTDKAGLLKDILRTHSLGREQVLCMGDDIPDIEMLKESGLACCPADAVPEIKERADYISPVNGGCGCVRDVIEKVMKLRGNWTNDTRVPSR